MGGAVEQVVVTVIRFVVVMFYGSSLYVRRSSSCVLNGGVLSKMGEDGVLHASRNSHPDSIGVSVVHTLLEVLLMFVQVAIRLLVKRVAIVAPVNVGVGVKVFLLAVFVVVIVYVVRKVGECLVSSASGGGRVFGDKYL